MRLSTFLLLTCFSTFHFSTSSTFQASAAQRATLSTVLERAGAYAESFQARFAGIVAEEHYVQNVRMLAGFSRQVSRAPTHRELRSDLLLVRTPGADRFVRWVQFRDVFEVDGVPVRDRNERLVKLFLEPSASSRDQALAIQAESSRYNIGNLERTVNVPVMALIFLEPEHQPRFAFKEIGQGRLGPLASVAPASDIRAVEYKEVEKGTLIRTARNLDLPSHGRFWIDASNGRVLKSLLIAEDTQLRGQVDVTYQLEPSVGLLVPSDMRERYLLRRENIRIDGVATYTRFRQFQVKTFEKIGDW